MTHVSYVDKVTKNSERLVVKFRLNNGCPSLSTSRGMGTPAAVELVDNGTKVSALRVSCTTRLGPSTVTLKWLDGNPGEDTPKWLAEVIGDVMKRKFGA